MKNAVSLITHHNVIVCRERRLTTRSPQLLRFLCYLWWKREHQPRAAWVGQEELLRVFDWPQPKQMQRHIDALESAGILLVEYRSKTNGAWRLALSTQQVSIDRQGDELLTWLDFDPQRMTAGNGPALDLGTMASNLRQVLMTDALFAEQGIQSDAVEESLAAYRALSAMPGISAPLKASLSQRRCQLYRQCNDFSAWNRELGELDAMLSRGELAGADFAARLRLQQVFLRYDTGRTQEARHLLERIDPAQIHDAFTLGRYYNAMGLASLQPLEESCVALSDCVATSKKCPLHAGLGHFSQALGYALAVNDYTGLEGICFNMGNALYRCVRLAPSCHDAQRLRDAAGWIGLCEMVCHRFGVGGAAHWSRLLLVDMAQTQGWDFATLNQWVGGAFTAFSDLENLLQQALVDAVGRTSRLEQAEACRLLMRVHHDKNDGTRAHWYREEAISIYRELGRNDKIAVLLSAKLPPPR